jgi:hypothetical protein
MTLAAATTRDDYVATSGQTVFPYTFTALVDSDVDVLKNGIALTLGAGNDYTISGIGTGSGNVTLNVGAATGDKIAIYLDMPIARTTNYQNSGAFLALDVNGDMNKAYLAMQQITTDMQAAIRRPEADPATISMELPVAVDRAQRLLAFDSNGAVTTQPYVGGQTQILSRDVFVGDGATTTFTLTESASDPSMLNVVVNGLMQDVSSYSLANGTSLIFSEAPPRGANIEVRSFVQVELVSTDLDTSEFAGNGSTTSFTLGSSAVKQNTFVYINGVYQFKSTYSVSGTSLTFSTAPPLGSGIEVVTAGFTTSAIFIPADDTVGTAQIQGNAVTTAKIADANVTAAKIASVPITVGITSVVTATSITATVNTHVYVSAATKTITLPASPTIGQRVLVTVGNFTDTVVGRNGSKIMSSATDFTMDAAYLSIQFIYTDATQGWVMS